MTLRRIWFLTFLVLPVALSTPHNASAASFGPCPSSTLGATNPPYTAAGGLCNVVITFNADSSITTVISNPNSYADGDDSLVGVVNNTSSPITAIHVSSATLALFGFDLDGACSSVYVAEGPCGGFRETDPGDYEGPNVSFSSIAADKMSGDVNFAGGIAANGGMSWFSLDEAPSTSFDVTPVHAVPEPTTFVLLGTGLLCLGLRKLRKQIP